MSYVDTNLLPGELVRWRGRVHPVTYLDPAVFAVLGFGLLFVAKVLGVLLLVVALGLLLVAYVRAFSTELAVTDRRVIAKFGLIQRQTIELLHSKVESVSVDQSIFGRMLGYGTIVVRGSGGAVTPIPFIAQPLEFRRAVLAAVDHRG